MLKKLLPLFLSIISLPVLASKPIIENISCSPPYKTVSTHTVKLPAVLYQTPTIGLLYLTINYSATFNSIVGKDQVDLQQIIKVYPLDSKLQPDVKSEYKTEFTMREIAPLSTKQFIFQIKLPPDTLTVANNHKVQMIVQSMWYDVQSKGNKNACSNSIYEIDYVN
jgi:hypothetical protein